MQPLTYEQVFSFFETLETSGWFKCNFQLPSNVMALGKRAVPAFTAMELIMIKQVPMKEKKNSTLPSLSTSLLCFMYPTSPHHHVTFYAICFQVCDLLPCPLRVGPIGIKTWLANQGILNAWWSGSSQNDCGWTKRWPSTTFLSLLLHSGRQNRKGGGFSSLVRSFFHSFIPCMFINSRSAPVVLPFRIRTRSYSFLSLLVPAPPGLAQQLAHSPSVPTVCSALCHNWTPSRWSLPPWLLRWAWLWWVPCYHPVWVR